jgi:N-acetylglucosamine kinase-like BadF-type ATPase
VTAVRPAVLNTFGRTSTEDVSAALHFGEIPADRGHDLVPVLFSVTRAGDQVARRLIDRLANEVVSMAAISLRRLGLFGTAADVVLGVGALTARELLLNDAIVARLAAEVPLTRVVVSEYPPIVGAVLRGLGSAVPMDVETAVRSRLVARLS